MNTEIGWEVEGFITRLTRRDDTNSERLVLEAISHLRSFSRDCDALRDALRKTADAPIDPENPIIRDMIEALNVARDHIDGEIDVVDGDYGVPRPNKAMQLASFIDDLIARIDADMNRKQP